MGPAEETVDLFDAGRVDDFDLPRLRWLIRLRWIALSGILLAALLTLSGAFPGVAWEVLLATMGAGALYNLILFRRHRAGTAPTGRRAAMVQALVDIVMLTLVLWAAGGVSSPFVAYYVFHVALVGILAGPRATFVAAGFAVAGAGVLSLTHVFPAAQIGVWNPVEPWGLITDVAAFITTAGGIAYIVTHAVRELRDRERALGEARDQVALEYQLLSNTLHELEAGLEVVDADGEILWRNKRAELIGPSVPANGRWACPGDEHSCERDVTGVCPMVSARENVEPGRCRFAVPIDGSERVYEMMAFPLAPDPSSDRARVMNLYVDRTEATLDERRLVTTERLVSLGRVAQGVAHELNTPLATIRTLATDMRAAMRTLSDGSARPAAVADDLDESAELIQDETRRLGKITQALLAGGDLVRTRVRGGVPLAAVVERARALVFAGVRDGPSVDVSAGVGDLTVVADPDRLVQVLVNLLQNALDAVRDGDRGAVRVRATTSGDAVELAIEDDGPGLPPEVRDRLFEPFTTTKPPGKGTGLGLYTSYMLVQAMGGTLTLEEREQSGKVSGVRAVVRLPAAAPDGLAPVSRLTQRAS